MSHKTFYRTAGVVFLIAFALHLLRVLNNWTLTVDAYVVPMWISWVLVALAGILTYYGLRRGR